MTDFNFEKLAKLDSPTRILNDRRLLDELGMNDAAAAMYLGKSRQALNFKLGAKRSQETRPPYFKISDILVLVIAARQLGADFDCEAVRDYIDRTRDKRQGNSEAALKLLDQLLRGIEDVNVDDPATVVFILPAFADLRAELPDFSQELKRIASALSAKDRIPRILLFSSTKMLAEMAADWLRLPKERTYALTHDYVDHYVPSVLVFDREKGDPRTYVLTERGGLIPAPQFRAPMMAECVRFMLPPDLREELSSWGRDDYEDGSETTPRIRA